MDIFTERKKLMKNYRLINGTILIILQVFIIIFKTFQWNFIDLLTPFIVAPLVMLIYVFAIIIFITMISTLILALIKKDKDNLAITIGIFVLCIIILFIPTDSYYEKVRFMVNKERFERIGNEMLKYDSGSNISLPNGYKDLSRGGGEVQIIGDDNVKIILFYSYRGILDNYSVYAYVPNQEAYKTLQNYEDWVQILKVRENWYFCASR